ncbi:hypothetical protein AAFF_G00147130 [Aldrovandia affinis]|uniref:Uncharacterized protein n=1 Tax=Aldrovandia affinis TaxID=143900 RepID=A0AAD7W985_9TELE|nr:hypothetical protein AAFF_G00147130 [Aldrovandia affinis]
MWVSSVGVAAWPRDSRAGLDPEAGVDRARHADPLQRGGAVVEPHPVKAPPPPPAPPPSRCTQRRLNPLQCQPACRGCAQRPACKTVSPINYVSSQRYGRTHGEEAAEAEGWRRARAVQSPAGRGGGGRGGEGPYVRSSHSPPSQKGSTCSSETAALTRYTSDWRVGGWEGPAPGANAPLKPPTLPTRLQRHRSATRVWAGSEHASRCPSPHALRPATLSRLKEHPSQSPRQVKKHRSAPKRPAPSPSPPPPPPTPIAHDDARPRGVASGMARGQSDFPRWKYPPSSIKEQRGR